MSLTFEQLVDAAKINPDSRILETGRLYRKTDWEF